MLPPIYQAKAEAQRAADATALMNLSCAGSLDHDTINKRCNLRGV